MTTIYNYHHETGEYLGPSEGFESPLEPGVVLLPAHATLIEPPAVSSLERDTNIFFRDGAWTILPDFRSVDTFSTETGMLLKVQQPGPLPIDITDKPRPSEFYAWSEVDNNWIYNRSSAESKVWDAITQYRDGRTYNGGYKVRDKWFHSDTQSRAQQQALALSGNNIPAGLQWKTMDGSFVTMTPTLAQQILAAQTASDCAIFTVSEAHVAAMKLTEHPEEYNFSTGWPEVYQQ